MQRGTRAPHPLRGRAGGEEAYDALVWAPSEESWEGRSRGAGRGAYLPSLFGVPPGSIVAPPAGAGRTAGANELQERARTRATLARDARSREVSGDDRGGGRGRGRRDLLGRWGPLH